MPSKIENFINSTASVDDILAMATDMFDPMSRIGEDAYFALHEFVPDVLANKRFAQGVMFKTNPLTGEPVRTADGDYYLTDIGLDIVQTPGSLNRNILDAFKIDQYTADDLDPGMRKYEEVIKKKAQPDPMTVNPNDAQEAQYRERQEVNASVPRRTNPDLGKEISREEWLLMQKNKQGIRPSAHASQMGVPSKPVPGTSSELPLEGSSSNQLGVNAVVPNYSFSDSVLTQADKLRRRLADPNTLRGGVRMSPDMAETLDGLPVASSSLGEELIDAAVEESAQQAAAAKKAATQSEPGNTPWWKNPWTYGEIALAGAGGVVGSLLVGGGNKPSYEEEMMMRAQYGQMPSSFDDRYGYY